MDFMRRIIATFSRDVIPWNQIFLRVFGVYKIAALLDKIIFSCKTFRSEDVIIIAGSPRTGTTWLMEILGSIPDYLTLYEPLLLTWFPKARDAGFTPRTYIPLNADAPRKKDYFGQVFAGKITSKLPHYRFTTKEIRRRFKANKLIIKFVRANRMLPWLINNFQSRLVIFLVRHPCATIASQLKTNYLGYMLPYGKLPKKEKIIEEVKSVSFLDNSILEKLKLIEYEEEICAAIWALDYYLPLSIPQPHQWIMVCYEDLMIHGEEEISYLLDYIAESEHLEKAFSKLKTPSILTREKNCKKVTEKDYQLNKWKKVLSKKQINRISEVLSWFNITFTENAYQIGQNTFPRRRRAEHPQKP